MAMSANGASATSRPRISGNANHPIASVTTITAPIFHMVFDVHILRMNNSAHELMLFKLDDERGEHEVEERDRRNHREEGEDDDQHTHSRTIIATTRRIMSSIIVGS